MEVLGLFQTPGLKISAFIKDKSLSDTKTAVHPAYMVNSTSLSSFLQWVICNTRKSVKTEKSFVSVYLPAAWGWEPAAQPLERGMHPLSAWWITECWSCWLLEVPNLQYKNNQRGKRLQHLDFPSQEPSEWVQATYTWDQRQVKINHGNVIDWSCLYSHLSVAFSV